MGAYSKLSKYFSNGIVAKAIELGYSDDNILILEGKENTLRNSYPEIWDNLQSCKHHRDRRTPLEYAQDLVASWVFEDCLISALYNAGLDITHAGADRNRKILSGSNVSASSDAAILVRGHYVPLEIMCDYTGFWTRTNRMDLRDSKYSKLKNAHSLFLGFSTVDNKVILLDFADDLNVTYTPSHFAYGGKPAYSIHISPNDLWPFKMPILINEIKSKCR